MNKKGAVLAGRIQAELKEFSILVERIELGMQKAKTQNDDFYLDSVALNLHGFYSGVERLFEKIGEGAFRLCQVYSGSKVRLCSAI